MEASASDVHPVDVDVFDHADFRVFLRAWFDARKRANPRFSHRAFARRLGSTDPSALASVLTGRRRLTPERTEDFVRVLGLVTDRAAYFRLLVAFGQAETPAERERAWAAIADLRSRLRAPEIDSSKFLYLSDRLYPAVQALAQCADFRPDPTWIARRLRPPVSEARAAEALDLLLRLGFLVRDGEHVRPNEPVVRTTQRVEHLGSYGYHRQSQALATEVLHALWESGSELAEDTAFLGLTLAVPHRRLAELRRLLWEAQLAITHQVEAWADDKDQVVQVVLQMFPVSEATDPD